MREVLRENAVARRLLLERLYATRMTATQQEMAGWLPRRVLADVAAHADFLLATLAEQGYLRRDGDRYCITGAGCAFLESTSET